MPGRIKQVPQPIQQNEIERIRGIVLTKTCVISILTLVLNPLVISYMKYIYWKYLLRPL